MEAGKRESAREKCATNELKRFGIGNGVSLNFQNDSIERKMIRSKEYMKTNSDEDKNGDVMLITINYKPFLLSFALLELRSSVNSLRSQTHYSSAHIFP